MKVFKRFTVLIFLFSLLISISCISEEDACEDCLDAQKHYFSALKNNSCNTIATLEARGKVINACNNGVAKADYLVSVCRDPDQPSPSYNCD